MTSNGLPDRCRVSERVTISRQTDLYAATGRSQYIHNKPPIEALVSYEAMREYAQLCAVLWAAWERIHNR